jgi:hypothetical protein
MDCGPFFFRARTVWVHLHDGAVDGQGFHLDADDLFLLQRREDAIKHPGLRPPVHSGVHRVPPTEPLRQAAPLASMLGDIQDRVQHIQVRDRDIPTLRRKAPFDAPKLLFGDHHTAR